MSDILAPYKNVIYINSANRSSGTSSNFTIDISKQLPKTPNIFNSIVLCSAAIPKSFYLITSGNNSFILNESGHSGIVVSIPIGNYDVYTLATQLASSLTSASLSSLTYTCTVNLQLGKYTFGVSSTNPSFDFTNKMIAYIIGFDETLYNFSANILASANVVNLQLTNIIQVNSDIVSGSDTVLTEIIPQQSNYGIILFTEQNPSYISKPIMSGYNFSAIKLWLLDQNGNQLDLNGLDWSCVLCTYKLNEFSNKMLLNERLKLLEKDI